MPADTCCAARACLCLTSPNEARAEEPRWPRAVAVSAPAQSLRRKGEVRRLPSGAFDLSVNINGDRDRIGVRIGPGPLSCPRRVPVSVERDGESHVVGWGRASIDRSGNPRVRGLWAATPMGEYVKTLLDREVSHYGNRELEASIGDDGARMYHVLGASFTLPPVLANPSLPPAAPAPTAATRTGDPDRRSSCSPWPAASTPPNLVRGWPYLTSSSPAP